MPLMTKSPSRLQKQSKNTKLELNVPLLLQMKLELKSSSLRKCGKVPMEPSEIFSMAQSSGSPFSSKTFLN